MVMKEVYVRNIVFGIADSLVSTVGLLSGIDVSGSTHGTIILTGLIYAFVESLSMAIGSFLSEQATEEVKERKETATIVPFIGGVTMFLSFLISSFIPLFPYLFLHTILALVLSIALSLLTLFIVGIVMARLSKISPWRHGMKMVFLGGAAIVIGAIIGKYIHAQ